MNTIQSKVGQFFALLLALIALLGATVKVQATSYTASTSGNWNLAATWGGGGFPQLAADTATIPAAINVTNTGTVSITSLTVASTGTCDNSGTLSLVNQLGSTGTFINESSGILNLAFSGAPSITTFTITAAGNTVNYTGNAGSGIKSTTYQNLGILGTGTLSAGLTVNGNFTLGGTASCQQSAAGTIGGNLVVGSQSTMNPSGNNLTVTGTTTVNGYMYTGSSGGTRTLSGNVTVNPGGYFNMASASWTLGGTLTDNGIFGLGATASIPLTINSVNNPSLGIFGGAAIYGSLITDGSFNDSGLVTLGGPGAIGGNNSTLTLSGGITDGGSGYSLTKIGSGSTTINTVAPSNPYSGSTIIDGGTLTLDFSVNGGNNLISTAPLYFGSSYFGGGTLALTGKASTTDNQTNNGVTLASGGNAITATIGSGGTVNLTLGTITRDSVTNNGTVDFTLPATGNISVGNANNVGGTLGNGWATVAGANWATVSGGNIAALSSYTTLPNTGAASPTNYTDAGAASLGANESGNSLRETGNATTLNLNQYYLSLTNGLLVTSNATIQANSSGTGGIGAGAGNEFVVYVASGKALTMGNSQSATGNANELIGPNSGGLTKTGPGDLAVGFSSAAAFAYTGPTIIHQGTINTNASGNLLGLSSSYIQIDAGASATFNSTSASIGNGAANQTLAGNGLWKNNSGQTIGAKAIFYPGGSNTYGGLIITANGVTVTSGATFVFDLSRIPTIPNSGTNNDQMFCNGTSGAWNWNSATVNLNINPMDGTLGVGSYTLMNASGSSQNWSGSATWIVTFPNGGDPGSANRSISYSSGNKNPVALVVSNTSSMPVITGLSGPTNNAGATSGNLSYSATTGSPTFYSITWNPAALAAGYINVTNSANTFSSGSGTLVVTNSPGATAGNYTGYLITSVGTVGGGNPSSYQQPFTVTISSCTSPTAYQVTGGTNCSGTGVSVGLINSTNTVTYALLTNGVTYGAVGSVVGSATGAALTPSAWSNLTAVATYTVVGTNTAGGCTTTMTGNAIVSQAPTTTYNMTGGSSGCSGTGLTIGLSSSDSGVTYQLLLNGSPVGSSVAGTNGLAISFGLQTAAGTYTVQGTNLGCGIVAISGGTPNSVVITATPGAPTSPSAVAGDGVITNAWTAPAGTVTSYNVYRTAANGGSGNESLFTNVSAPPFIDTSVVDGSQYFYKVTALNGTCEGAASTEVSATPNPAYTAYVITDAAGGNLTAGAGDVLTITATNGIGGVAPIGGPISIIFSGLSNSPSGTSPTMGGTAFSAGSVTNIVNFTNGVGNTTLVAYNAGTGKTLTATDGTHSTSGSAGSPLSLTVSPAASSAYRLTGGGSPTVAVSYPVNVALVDQYQNVETGTNASQSLTFNAALTAGANGSPATINGVATNTPALVSFTNGLSGVPLVAHYPDVSGKVITVTNTTLMLASYGTGGTNLILGTVTNGAANQLSMNQQPPSTATVGVTFSPSPVVNVLDVYSNLLTGSSLTISASASANILQGTTNVNAGGGLATFSSLSMTNVGSITLTFSSGVLTPVTSSAISVGGGTVTQVIWATQPGNANSGVAFSPQPVMETADQYGNFSTNGLQSSLPVTIVITNGTGTLIGTTNYDLGTAISNGVATTTGLGVTGSGSFNLAIIVSGIYGLPVSGMAIWLDANNASTVLTNASGVVTNWLDLSGSNNNFGVYLSGGGNILYTNHNAGYSNRRTVTFNADELANTSYTNTTANISVFAVFKKTANNANPNYQRVGATWDGVSGGNNADYQSQQSFNMDLDTGNNQQRIVRAEGGSPGDMNGLADGAGFSTNYWDDEYVANSMTNWVYMNGALQNTYITAAISFGIKSTSVGGGLSNTGGINTPLLGDVGELIIYTSTLNTANRQSVETYLKNKWVAPAATNTSAVVSAPFTVANIVTPVFTGLNSTNLTYGTASVTLTGTCKNGSTYPGATDPISATINGITVAGSFNDSVSGNFTINYNDPSLATNSVGNNPYAITYTYGGNGSTLNPATNSATTLTINQAVPAATLTVSNSPVTYNASGQSAVVGIVSSSVPGTLANILTGGAATQTAVGTYAATANFVPADNIDYATLTNVSAGSFVIQPATPTATLAVNNPTVTYNGAGQTASVGVTVSSVPGTTGGVQYNSSATLPTNASSYAVTANFVPTDTNYTTLVGLSAGSFTILPATPVLSVSNTPVSYNGLGQSAVVTSSVPGVVTNIVTGGQASQTNASTYGVTANFTPADTTDYVSLTNATAGNFVIQPAVPVLSVSNTPVTYTGSAYTAVVTSSVPGSVSGVLMNGQPTQTSANSYGVTASFVPVDNIDYASLTNVSAGNFVIQPAIPSVTIYLDSFGSTNVTVTYDGSGHTAQYDILLWSSSPAGNYNTVLSGGAAYQTNVGVYTVTLNWVPNNNNYLTLTGLVVGTYTIQPATPVVTAAPTASAITNGQTLASSMLTGGSATPSGGVFTFTTNSIVPPVGTNSESVTYTYSDTNYATATTNVSVIVYPGSSCTGPAIVGGISGQTNLCVGSPLVLTLTNVTGTTPFFYQWQTNNVAIVGGTNSAYTNLTVAVTDSGNYVCVVTNACGSITSSVATVTVNPPPTVSVNSVTNCGTVSSILTATSSAGSPTYLWSDGETTASITNSSPAVTTNYTVMVTDGVTGCVNSGGGGIVVNPLPAVSVNSVTNYGTVSTILTATTSASSPTYLWSDGETNASITNSSPSVTTNYTVMVTDGVTGCANSAGGTIVVNPVPTLSITGSGANVLVKWTNTAAGFNLEMTTNLALPQVWTTNLTVPAVIGGQYTVTNPASGPVLFYRLSH